MPGLTVGSSASVQTAGASPVTATVLPVVEMGVVAAARLQDRRPDRQFEVHSACDSSVYLNEPGCAPSIVLLGAQAPPGPAALRCRIPPGWRWPGRMGAAVRSSSREMVLEGGARLTLDFRTARVWSPPGAGCGYSLGQLRRGLKAWKQLAPQAQRCPGARSSWFLGLGTRETLSALAWVGVQAADARLGHWQEVLNTSLRRVANAPDLSRSDLGLDWGSDWGAGLGRGWAATLEPLLGLGPGLTPAGDDFICGVLVALHRLGYSELAGAIWHALAPLAGRATNPISVFHLTHAGLGMAASPLHEALEAVLSGERDVLGVAVTGLDRFGHSSGWDGWAGALSVLQAVARWFGEVSDLE